MFEGAELQRQLLSHITEERRAIFSCPCWEICSGVHVATLEKQSQHPCDRLNQHIISKKVHTNLLHNQHNREKAKDR